MLLCVYVEVVGGVCVCYLVFLWKLLLLLVCVLPCVYVEVVGVVGVCVTLCLCGSCCCCWCVCYLVFLWKLLLLLVCVLPCVYVEVVGGARVLVVMDHGSHQCSQDLQVSQPQLHTHAHTHTHIMHTFHKANLCCRDIYSNTHCLKRNT